MGDPTEGALLVLAHKAGLDLDATRERYPRVATLPFDPTYKLMAAFTGTRTARDGGRAVLREGSGAGGDESRRERAVRGSRIAWDERLSQPGAGQRPADGGSRIAGNGRRLL